MKEVVILAFDNCLTSSVVGMLDIFQIANQFLHMSSGRDEDMFQVKLATVKGESIQSFSGFPIPSSVAIEELQKADYLIVPPVMNRIDEVIAQHPQIVSLISTLHAQGTKLASVCTGVFFLGESGLLGSKTITTNPLMLSLFRQRFPDVKIDADRVLIDCDDVITVGPTYAFLDLVIYLIEKYGGSELALQCSKLLLHDKNRVSQVPYHLSTLEKTHNDDEVHAVQQWLRVNCTAPLTIEEIARRFHMSPRNLVRRFRNATDETPLHYLQRLRVENAKRKLEQSRRSIDQITSEVGYSDVKSFGRLFKRYTSLSPSEYRKRFSSRSL